MTIPVEHLRSLERMYCTAPCNQALAPRISIEQGRAEIVIDVRADSYHSVGAIHGSVYFKLLDDAAYFSASSLNSDWFLLTVTFTVHFLHSATEGAFSKARRQVT